MRTARASGLAALTMSIALGLTTLAPIAAQAGRTGNAAPGIPVGINKQCFKPMNPGTDAWYTPTPKRCPKAVRESSRLKVPLVTVAPNFDVMIPAPLAEGRYFLYLDNTPLYWSSAGPDGLYLQIEDAYYPKGLRTLEVYDTNSQLVGWFEINVDYDW